MSQNATKRPNPKALRANLQLNKRRSIPEVALVTTSLALPPTITFLHASNNIDNNNIHDKLPILKQPLFFFLFCRRRLFLKRTTKHLILNFYKSALLIRMYKCIKLREIESALCCLPSVPGQCNELANISKKETSKNYVGFRPLILLLEQKQKTK